MSKLKKLVCVIFFAFLIDDICRYIKAFAYNHAKSVVSFDLISTTFDTGKMLNLSVVYIFMVSFIYFCINFFKIE